MLIDDRADRTFDARLAELISGPCREVYKLSMQRLRARTGHVVGDGVENKVVDPIDERVAEIRAFWKAIGDC